MCIQSEMFYCKFTIDQFQLMRFSAITTKINQNIMTNENMYLYFSIYHEKFDSLIISTNN